MKKLLIVLCALLLAMLPLCASAATLVSQHNADSVVYLGTVSNTYVVASDAGYQIFNAKGEAVGPVWPQMGPKQNGAFYQVLNNGSYSMVAADGTLVLPGDYFAFASPGSGWMLGIVMEQTEDENCDYTSKAGMKMNIVRVEVAYGNKLLGSIARGDYMADCSTGVVGGYLYILHTDGRCLWFDSALNKTAETLVTSEDPVEYEIVDGKCIHVPTQQQAFVSTCTLKAEDVNQSAVTAGDKLLDLQGNVMMTMPEGTVNKQVEGGYLYLETGSGVGLWNLQGEQVIPAVNSELAENLVGYFPTGYQGALDQNGHLHFYDKTGAETAVYNEHRLANYNLSGFLFNSPIMAVSMGDGLMLITATQGALPGRYEDVEISYYGQQIVAAKQGGLWGCVDMEGNAVVPFVHSEEPEISNDGTLVLGAMADGSYVVYNIAY